MDRSGGVVLDILEDILRDRDHQGEGKNELRDCMVISAVFSSIN